MVPPHRALVRPRRRMQDQQRLQVHVHARRDADGDAHHPRVDDGARHHHRAGQRLHERRHDGRPLRLHDAHRRRGALPARERHLVVALPVRRGAHVRGHAQARRDHGRQRTRVVVRQDQPRHVPRGARRCARERQPHGRAARDRAGLRLQPRPHQQHRHDPRPALHGDTLPGRGRRVLDQPRGGNDAADGRDGNRRCRVALACRRAAPRPLARHQRPQRRRRPRRAAGVQRAHADGLHDVRPRVPQEHVRALRHALHGVVPRERDGHAPFLPARRRPGVAVAIRQRGAEAVPQDGAPGRGPLQRVYDRVGAQRHEQLHDVHLADVEGDQPRARKILLARHLPQGANRQ
eukprot:PhM_4_TR16759/c0_g1_i1/m.26600